MNILIFSEAAWDDKNSFGNTVSNFFCGDIWENDKFLNYYARNQIPDNKANVNYYQLSAVDVIKGALKLKIRGKKFSSKDIATRHNLYFDHEREQRSIDKLHKNKNEFVYYVHEAIWRSRIWINEDFDSFINQNKPDVLFAFATSPYILWPLIKYLKKKTMCKIVLLVADNTYEGYEKNIWYRRRYLKRMLKNCILSADRVYGISDEMSQLYQDMFHVNVTTLYKGCDLSLSPKNYTNNPLRFVYAGNLFWGRDDILSTIAETIEDQNQNGVKAVLEIYTGATITPELEKKLNHGESSRIMGARPYDEIKQIMHDADVVLHVESFDEDSIETVKYSLSTKIIDCLQSGSQVFGIGPNGIASIEYLKKVDGAIVVDSREKIKEQLSALLQDKNILEHVKQIREYATEKHEISEVQNKLRKELEKLI